MRYLNINTMIKTTYTDADLLKRKAVIAKAQTALMEAYETATPKNKEPLDNLLGELMAETRTINNNLRCKTDWTFLN